MKFGRLVITAITAILAVAAAVTAVVYFKDEILEFMASLGKRIDVKTTRMFHNNEYTDYADI